MTTLLFLPPPFQPPTVSNNPIPKSLVSFSSSSVRASAARGKTKDLVLGNPSVSVEKGKYSYDVSTLIDKLSSLPPRGSIARCLDSFRHRLSLPDFALVFREFASRGDWQRSLRLFKYMQRQAWCRPDELIHAILVSLLASHSLLDKALEVFHDTPHPRSPLSYNSLISALANNDQHESALSVLDQMRADNVQPNLHSYNIALRAAARADLPFPRLLSLLAQMRRDSIHPDVTTYTTLISAAAARGLPDQAEAAFRAMADTGVPPDRAAHVALADAFARAGQLGRAAALFAEMEAAGRPPDADAYEALLAAHARAGDAPGALAALRQMQAAGRIPGAGAYRALLGLYGRSGRYEDVRELFLEMKVGSAAPDVPTYNILVGVFGEGGYFKEVVTLFRDMVEEGVEPVMETYEGVAFACGKAGLHVEAKSILAHMNDKGVMPSPKAYTGVVEAYGQAALYEEALVAFNTMNEVGSVPTVETYNSLLRTFGQGGLFKESQAILTRMSNAEVQRDAESFNALIEAYCQGGQFEDTLKAYLEMQKSRCNPNEQTLETILNVYCSAGLVEESKDQFLEIHSAGVVPSVMAYCMLISVYAKNDRWADAYQLLEEMQTNRVSNTHQVIGSMIKGDYDDESNWQMVEYVFDKYNSEGCGFGVRFYNALLEALWWLRQKARAARVLREAKRRGLFPELHRESKLVWSVDVHRMLVGGALAAISVWLNDIHQRFKGGDDLPHLATVVVARGEVEKSLAAKELLIAKAAYSFLRDKISPSFQFPGWNKGRIICHRSQLKRILSATPDMVSITDSDFPLPGTQIYTAEAGSDDQPRLSEEETGSESEPKLMATAR